MAMDGLALYAALADMRPLIGAKIDKVQQPEKDLILLTLRSHEGTQRLLICIHAENGRMHLTQRAYENPAQAPAFCMLLRRRLIGGRILGLTQNAADRIVSIDVRSKDELHDETDFRLIVELTGKHANLALVDANGSILDALRRVSIVDADTRAMLPGFPYVPPESQHKRNPLEASESECAVLYANGVPDARALTSTFDGLSKSTATALIASAPTPDALAAQFSRLAAERFSPCVVYRNFDEPIAVLPFTPDGLGERIEPEQTISAALDRFYADRDAVVRIRRHGGALRKTASVCLSRAEHKYAAFQETIASSDALEEFRVYGELILANLHSARAGAKELYVTDYYADPPAPRAIPLDETLSPQENAKRYFKQYRKGKLAKAYAESQIDALRVEVDYLEGVLEAIDRSESIQDLGEIHDELIREGYLRAEKKAGAKKQERPSSPLIYRSSDNIVIRVGKNNRQNDQLTLQTARPDNIWLHAKNIPGSHVVIDCDEEPPETTLIEAAMLAAYHSKAQHSSNVPVDYTPRRYVKKPSGARPGMVIYSTNRTICVTPDAALIKSLRALDT